MRTWVTNEIVTAAQLNQEIRDNLGCFASMIAYTDGALLSGWADYSATAGGRYIVATPTSGSTGGTVGAAMTNLQNKTHLHTGGTHTHDYSTVIAHTHNLVNITNAGGGYANKIPIQALDLGSTPLSGYVESTGAASGTTGNNTANNSGNASTGDFAPYIQLLMMKKSA